MAVIRFVEALPRSRTYDTLGRQLLRSATSIGANYRAACRGKSRADLTAKLAVVEEEADETLYWLELFEEMGSGREVEPEEALLRDRADPRNDSRLNQDSAIKSKI